jgi:hypothetical protein
MGMLSNEKNLSSALQQIEYDLFINKQPKRILH